MQHFGRKMCTQLNFSDAEISCQTITVISFSSLKCYLLPFYPFILSAGLAGQKAFLHLHISPPHNFLAFL